MSGAHKITGANAGEPHQLPIRTRWAARVAQFLRYARMSTKQTDEDFVAECGLSHTPEAAKTAVDLRKRLAEYGGVEACSLMASMKIIDTGLLHPTDSIDLVEFTFHMEDILGEKLDSADFQPMVDAGAEEMTIQKWVLLVLELQKRKECITNRIHRTPR